MSAAMILVRARSQQYTAKADDNAVDCVLRTKLL